MFKIISGVINAFAETIATFSGKMHAKVYNKHFRDEELQRRIMNVALWVRTTGLHRVKCDHLLWVVSSSFCFGSQAIFEWFPVVRSISISMAPPESPLFHSSFPLLLICWNKSFTTLKFSILVICMLWILRHQSVIWLLLSTSLLFWSTNRSFITKLSAQRNGLKMF